MAPVDLFDWILFLNIFKCTKINALNLKEIKHIYFLTFEYFQNCQKSKSIDWNTNLVGIGRKSRVLAHLFCHFPAGGESLHLTSYKAKPLSWNGTWVEARAFPWRGGGGKFCLRFFYSMRVWSMRLATVSTHVTVSTLALCFVPFMYLYIFRLFQIHKYKHENLNFWMRCTVFSGWLDTV